MNLLLDTHVWLWWLADDRRLPRLFRDSINEPDNQVSVSAVSVWEVRIKSRSGKIRIDSDPVAVSAGLGLDFLPFTIGHANRVASLPELHRDPFDRALIAQALFEDTTLLSLDEAVRRYPGLRLL